MLMTLALTFACGRMILLSMELVFLMLACLKKSAALKEVF